MLACAGTHRYRGIDIPARPVTGAESEKRLPVLRTLAASPTTFHFARSQASADSSFSPHAKAQGRKMKCWETEHFVLTLRLCALRETSIAGNAPSRKSYQLAGRAKISRFPHSHTVSPSLLRPPGTASYQKGNAIGLMPRPLQGFTKSRERRPNALTGGRTRLQLIRKDPKSLQNSSVNNPSTNTGNGSCNVETFCEDLQLCWVERQKSHLRPQPTLNWLRFESQ
jgi:hypothetical protein